MRKYFRLPDRGMDTASWGMKSPEHYYDKKNNDLMNTKRRIADAIMELKLAERNIRVIIRQNILDATPNLISTCEVSELERKAASKTAVESMARAKAELDRLLA